MGLDFSQTDQSILSYVNYLGTILKPEKIYFVHVQKDFLEPTLNSDYFDSVIPVDESLRTKLRSEVLKLVDDREIKLEFEVLEGGPFETVLHWTQVKKIDLVITGKKLTPDSNGILPNRLARKLACDILFVPEAKSSHLISKILVPVDFSEHSSLAVQMALKIGNRVNCNVTCVHIYSVPVGYSKSGKSFDEFAEIMKGNAVNAFDSFKDSFKDDISCEFILGDGSSTKSMLAEIQKQEADLVVVGSRGQTSSSVILLGSTTEKLINLNELSPTLVVKKPNENIGLIEALKSI